MVRVYLKPILEPAVSAGPDAMPLAGGRWSYDHEKIRKIGQRVLEMVRPVWRPLRQVMGLQPGDQVDELAGGHHARIVPHARRSAVDGCRQVSAHTQ